MTSNRTNATSGSTVVLMTVTPDSDYELDALTVANSQGEQNPAERPERWEVSMPSRAVTVTATFKLIQNS